MCKRILPHFLDYEVVRVNEQSKKEFRAR